MYCRWLMIAILSPFLGVGTIAFADELAKTKAAPAVQARYAQAVSPFLTRYCLDCHGASKPKADLNLLTYSDEASVVRA